jgi:hypothetical protein
MFSLAMPGEPTAVKAGQRVWCKGRAATFLYYAGEGAAVVRFEGQAKSTVVARATLSADPRDSYSSAGTVVPSD